MSKTKDDYPMVLRVEDIMEILHISKRIAYALMDETDFPCIRIGKKLKRVNRDDFFDWLQQKGMRS